ncbi:glucosyltransferase [Epicoccum nigrum]|nr:glucosyltransferase [Epicoccum nigrum]
MHWQDWQEHVAGAAFAAGLTAWAALVAEEVPAPYLDEFFHVPQAQKYCAGEYTWDPKITTPPGLYLVAKLLSPLCGCSTGVLRAQNVVALILIMQGLIHIRRFIQTRGYLQRRREAFVDKLNDNTSSNQIDVIEDGLTPFSTALTAFNIASFPPLYFFGALYYTDVMSTAAVLMSYGAFLATTAKPQRTLSDDVLAVISGIIALFFRQTNIFWVAVFPAGLTVVSVLGDNGRMKSRAAKDGYLSVLKENSLLFLLTTALAALSFVFISAGLFAVHFNTVVHPYTLADNRHYVFYVFRLLLRHPLLKYLAVPVYYACFWLSIQSLAHPTDDLDAPPRTIQARPHQEAIRNTKLPVQISFVIIWLITTALCVVTAPLVEPRYFIVPWIVWRLHVPHAPTTFTVRGRTYSPDLRVIVETVWLIAINQTLQHYFLNKPFTWPSEPESKQRFLW